MVPQFEAFRDSLVSGLQAVGIIKGEAKSDSGAGMFPFVYVPSPLLSAHCDEDASKAKQALTDAERELSNAKSSVETGHKDLDRLFDPAWYGKEGEWKKLDGLCLDKDTGECVSRSLRTNRPRRRVLTPAIP